MAQRCRTRETQAWRQRSAAGASSFSAPRPASGVRSQTCALAGGARVVVAARRTDRLREVAAAGDGVAVECDVRDAADRRRLVDVAAHELGAVDAFVYMAARVPMVMMVDESPEGWADLFATNASGAFLTFAALRRLLIDDAIVAYAASSGVTAPYHGRGAYTVSKAALDEGVRALRIEHPHAAFHPLRARCGRRYGGRGVRRSRARPRS